MTTVLKLNINRLGDSLVQKLSGIVKSDIKNRSLFQYNMIPSFSVQIQVDSIQKESRFRSLLNFVSRKKQQLQPDLSSFRDLHLGLNLKLFESTQDRPQLSIELKEDSLSEGRVNEFLREVIFPDQGIISQQLSDFPQLQKLKGFPNLFVPIDTNSVPQSSIGYRFFPVMHPTFIVYTQDFAELSTRLRNSGLNIESITGGPNYEQHGVLMKETQLILADFKCIGIDLRITNYPSFTKFIFNDSSSVLDGTIPSIQSARVFGGADHILETKYGYSGDCWSEVREMSKHYIKQQLQGVDPVKKTKQKLAKDPSLIE
jgi:hypothetical protein